MFEPDGSPNGFHVDHLMPICDGGSNDEENLVPACASCNHKRARLVDPTSSPVNVGKASDIKAQKPEATARNDMMGERAGASVFTEGSKRLTNALWRALGFNSPLDVPPEYSGIEYRAVEWERAGWTDDLILSEGRKCLGKPLSYIEKVFATAFAKRQAPLPIVEIKPAEKMTVTHGKPKNAIIQAADDLCRKLASFDGPARGSDELCGDESKTSPRLLSHG